MIHDEWLERLFESLQTNSTLKSLCLDVSETKIFLAEMANHSEKRPFTNEQERTNGDAITEALQKNTTLERLSLVVSLPFSYIVRAENDGIKEL